MKHIVVNAGEVVRGAGLCQLTCSAQNFRLNTHKSARIGIVPRFPEGYFEVHLCNQCGVCLPVCPVEAISVDAGGAYVIDDSMCIDCGACVDSCPQQAIFRSPASPASLHVQSVWSMCAELHVAGSDLGGRPMINGYGGSILRVDLTTRLGQARACDDLSWLMIGWGVVPGSPSTCTMSFLRAWIRSALQTRCLWRRGLSRVRCGLQVPRSSGAPSPR